MCPTQNEQSAMKRITLICQTKFSGTRLLIRDRGEKCARWVQSMALCQMLRKVAGSKTQHQKAPEISALWF